MEMKIVANKQNYFIDWDKFNAQKQFEKALEQEYWKYHFSGQRTIDLFGEEKAKKVLKEQDAREFNSRHTKED